MPFDPCDFDARMKLRSAVRKKRERNSDAEAFDWCIGVVNEDTRQRNEARAERIYSLAHSFYYDAYGIGNRELQIATAFDYAEAFVDEYYRRYGMFLNELNPVRDGLRTPSAES